VDLTPWWTDGLCKYVTLHFWSREEHWSRCYWKLMVVEKSCWQCICCLYLHCSLQKWNWRLWRPKLQLTTMTQSRRGICDTDNYRYWTRTVHSTSIT